MKKANNGNVAAKAIAAVGEGIPYDKMDCHALVEYCVNQCGGKLESAGSNDMARNHCAWLGTLDNAAMQGKLVKGAALLIHENTEENLPAKYRGDGLGDFSHIALYVGEKALYDQDKNGIERLCNAVHCSQTMGRAAGTTTENGFTHVMLLDCIDYGMELSGLAVGAAAEEILNDGPAQSGNALNNEGQTVQAAQQTYVVVTSANGEEVRIREKPQKGAIWKYAAPVGTRLLVLGHKNGYYKVVYRGKTRWLDEKYGTVE